MDLPLVEYRDFSASFEKEVVHGISFALRRGSITAMVGESGSGKTVTAKALLRLQSAEHISYGGSVFFEGRDVLSMSDKELGNLRGKKVGMVFQEPMTSLNPLHRIEKQLAESLILHKKVSKKDARDEVIAALTRAGLSNAQSKLESYPHELSGGERQRVMIALALANDPLLLIADEPTTALDVTLQAEVLALLKDLQKKLNLAILFITHDLSLARCFADDIIVMKDGAIIEHAKTPLIFGAPKEEYTKLLLAADSVKTENSNPLPSNAPLAARVEDLKVYFPIKKGILRKTCGYIKAVRGVTFDLREGESLGLVGESGSGKTTLGKALLRLEKSTGKINILGRDISSLTEKELRPMRPSMQIIFQDPYGSLSPRMTVRDIVGEGLLVHKLCTQNEITALVLDALSEVGLADRNFLDRYPNEFSGGQRQRIAIARSLILAPRILVLDEPTSSLDRTVQVQIIDLLLELQRKRRLSYIFISHDLRVVKSLCHNVLIMKDGEIVERGHTRQVLENPVEKYTQSLVNASALVAP